MRSIIIFTLLLGLLFFGCVGTPQQPPANQTNVTQPYSAKMGDVMNVTYSLRLDGNSTEMQSGTLIVPLYTEAGFIPGFIDGLVGMHESETKTFKVAPEKGYGMPSPGKMELISRNGSMPFYFDIPVSQLSQNTNINISTWEKGRLIDTTKGTWVFEKFDADNAVFSYYLFQGSKFQFPGPDGITSVVTHMDNETIEFMLFPVENATYYIDYAQTTAVARNITDETFILDFNSPLAGKTLVFTVRANSIQRIE
ncbi:MAG: FKBP-type peptidyl-prolyl cis-trans isomerase [Candidatus Bilamarchaeaceae archaeon]